MIQYILECIAFQLVFLLIYDLFLKRETFFQWNRVYLIGTYAIALLLPWVKIEAFKTEIPATFNGYSEFLWSLKQQPVVLNSETVETVSFTWQEALFISGMILAALWFGFKLWRLFQLKRKGKVSRFRNFTQVLVPESSIAFSFFKSIFLGDKLAEHDRPFVISHELVHIRQRHTLDLLFFELMRMVSWFNPLVYVYQNRISELHEFIADAQVPKTEINAHYELLLSQIFQTQHISFVNQFFKSSLIKKRIVMLQKSKSKKVWQLKYVLLVPMILGMLAYTSIEQEKRIQNGKIQTKDDTELIEKVSKELDVELKNWDSVKNYITESQEVIKLSSGETIPTKEEYFKNEILHRKFFIEFYDDKGFDQNLKNKFLSEQNLPSTAGYESHVNRIKAFTILDPDLQYSIDRKISDVYKNDFSNSPVKGSFLIEVADVRNMSKDDLIKFNRAYNEIIEITSATYISLVLRDDKYMFTIYPKKYKKVET